MDDMTVDVVGNRRAMESSGVEFQPGLTTSEFRLVEELFGFSFPDDLREHLSYSLPVGSGFPNWRRPNSPELAAQVAAQYDGVGTFMFRDWPEEWGSATPRGLEAWVELVERKLREAPKLIPVHRHRYMPNRPVEAGNPVFSVLRGRVSYVGTSLQNYLHNQYHYAFSTPRYDLSGDVRSIETWTALAETGPADRSRAWPTRAPIRWCCG